MEEKEFYNNDGVSVTNARFRVGTNTYAMNGVTSVKRGQTEPNRAAPIVLGIIGLITVFVATGLGAKAFGVLMVVLAIFWVKKLTPEYSVYLNSASGESQALSSKDKLYIDKVINALNESIVHRG